MKQTSGLSAGLTLIVVVALFAGAGALVGDALAGAKVLGGIAGGAVGVVVSFWALYRMYLRPMQQATMKRDYSNLEPKLDDDE